MKRIINGGAFNFDLGQSITSAPESLELDPKRAIVEHDKTLVKQKDYDQYTVHEDDQLELLEPVGGRQNA